MKPISPIYSHDALLTELRTRIGQALTRTKTPEKPRSSMSNLDCLMSGLAVFTFKYPSLLQFDQAARDNQTLLDNLKRLFDIHEIPCDTYMRTRLDEIDPQVLRPAFTKLFQLLDRSKILENFRFMEKYVLISMDGTGVFSSSRVHCDSCCVKNHRDGRKTYYHQILSAALVHPDQKVVFPLAPEPILKTDGAQKNDCERNAAKRWIADFRREHPHLNAVILADGLLANEPFISLLRAHHLSFILVCKETDHAYLTDWVNAMAPQDKITHHNPEGTRTYEIIQDVPLNDAKHACRVNVVRFQETVKNKTAQWMWVTDLIVTKKTVETFVKGARARWKIENETFNTLKNQGYEFEHNFGHGQKNLHTVFSFLMMLAFLIDQCLQQVNRFFDGALKKSGSKKVMWLSMLYTIKFVKIPNFETLYYCIKDPPGFEIPSIV